MVEGEGGVLVRLARCCNPIPGDPIIGYITRGRGVSVHRADCPNVINESSDFARVIEVNWDIGLDKVYTVTIDVTCNDKSGVLTNLLAVPSESKINISAVYARANKSNKTSIVTMGLDVKNALQLEQIMTKFRRIKDVYSVTRSITANTKED